MATYKGIDVSFYQGNIDWNKVKAAGIKFAILKAGGSDSGFYVDKTFSTNYYRAKDAGIAVGAYYFAGPYFQGKAAGKADAERFLHIIKGKKFEYPLVIDIEAQQISRKARTTDAAIAFCETLERAGYYAMIYASDISGFHDRLQTDRLNAYDKWVAKYSSRPPEHVKKFGIWQHSCKGRVNGIKSYVDLDISYNNYPAIIKNAGLNGYKKVSKK